MEKLLLQLRKSRLLESWFASNSCQASISVLVREIEVEWLTTADIEGKSGNAEVPLVSASSVALIDWQGG